MFMQSCDKSKKSKAPKQGISIRTRGVQYSYKVTRESSVDFWTPAFGGTFRLLCYAINQACDEYEKIINGGRQEKNPT